MPLTNKLRSWFGPSRGEIWRELSEQIGAKYVEARWQGDRVEASHGEWTITLDRFLMPVGKVMIPYTRMRAPYVNADDFRFSVSRAGVFTELFKFFGMQDVSVGFEPFDSEFVIKGTSDEKLHALFANDSLRALLLAQSDVHFAVRSGDGWFGPKAPPDADILEFYLAGDIREVDRLASLFELLAETLDSMCRIGSAYHRAPGLA